jgi:hypothetical protein
MTVYSPTGSGNIRIDQVLTNISLAYPATGLVGEQLFPVVPVRKQSDKYYVFGREAWLPETSDYRAPGTEANEIPGYSVSLDTYYAQEHSLQIAVTDEERENTDSPMSPDRDGAELVTSKILLGRELAMYKEVTDATKYATGLSVTLSGTAQWNDYVNSDPILNIKAALRAVHAKVFFLPNVAVIPFQVMSVLEDHPDIIERIKYSERAILTQEIIASVLGLDKVIVPGVAIGSGAVGVTGFGVTAGYLWGKDVILAYVPARPGLKTPAFAYEFAWTYGGQVMVTDRWREEKRKSDVIRVSRRYDLKRVGVEINPASPDFGKTVVGYIIKNAIA